MKHDLPEELAGHWPAYHERPRHEPEPLATLPPMTPRQIGATLRRERTAQGLSIRQAAASAGISTRVLQDMETAGTAYTCASLHQYAKALGLQLQLAPKKPRK